MPPSLPIRCLRLIQIVLRDEPAFLFALLCYLNPRLWRKVSGRMRERILTLQGPGGKVTIAARVADTFLRRAAGFRGATSEEIERTLILFDFGREVVSDMSMRDVSAPLDIAFIKGDGRLFSILRMAPDPAARYRSPGPFRYALEARAGFFEHREIRPGEAVLMVER